MRSARHNAIAAVTELGESDMELLWADDEPAVPAVRAVPRSAPPLAPRWETPPRAEVVLTAASLLPRACVEHDHPTTGQGLDDEPRDLRARFERLKRAVREKRSAPSLAELAARVGS